MEQGKDYPKVAEYLLRAQHLRALLANKFACGNIWYLAAQLIVPMNYNDLTYHKVIIPPNATPLLGAVFIEILRTMILKLCPKYR